MATKSSYAQFYSGSVPNCVGGGSDYRTLGSYATVDNVYLYINPYSLGVPIGSVITNIKISLKYRGTTTSDGSGILYSSNLYWRPVYINTTPSGTSISGSPTELGSKATVKESFGHSTSYKDSGDLSQDVSSITVASNTYVGARFYLQSKNAPEMRMHLNAVNITVTYTEHNHSYTSSVTKQPTCTTAGETTYSCSCGDSYVDKTIPAALGHSFGSTTYTWSADGKSCTAQRVCSRDSSHKETSTATITSAVKTAATCLAKGTTTYTAKFSVSWASTQTKDVQDIAQKSHSYTGAIKSDGNSKTATHSFQCVNGCGNYGGAVTHTWNSGVVAIEPDCIYPGQMLYNCTASGCGAVYTETVPAKGHTEVTDKAVAATCTTTGLTEGKHCSVCNTVITAQQTVAALGHDYKSTVIAPTATSRGYTRHTCSRCGDYYDDSFTYLVTFKSDSGATLKTETVAHGNKPTPPTAPTKADTAQWKYTFDGWYDANGNKWYSSTTITDTTTYTARYTSTVQKYTVRWFNYDGSLLETDTDVAYGTKPTYNGDEPTKEGNAEHSYQFAGWNYNTENGITPTLGTTYIDITAQFTEIDNTYTVKWENEGKVIETDTLVPYGAKPDYNGATPTKASDAQYDYTFIGWSTSVTDPAKPESELETVKGNVTYTAIYSATTKLYPIKVILFDTELTRVVEYGTDITFEAPDDVIGYQFVEWTDGNTDNPRTVKVTGEATYQAVYERIPIPIKVNLEQVTGVYIVPTTQTIVYVINGTVPTVETKTHTVNGWHFLVSNAIPENGYPLKKLFITDKNGVTTRVY